jgi:UDP-glucose:(heptosyl)LPS alpha-1,3-glucosyltransferase
MTKSFSISFARRGYSASGGAEAYLKRLARGLADLGHEASLFTTSDWPRNDWPFGELKHLRARSPLGFASELAELRREKSPDVLMSLERIYSCDVYRAGDGVHRAWINRRTKFETPLQKLRHSFNRKHQDILRLEKSLLQDRGAGRVIANSLMVKNEIVEIYNYPPEKIDIVRNGIPLDQFQFDSAARQKSRGDLGLEADELAVLFAGSGWERKGLRFAIEAVQSVRGRKIRLLVAGRGRPGRYPLERTKFLGEVLDLRPIYAAADIFILPTIYDPFSNASLEALAAGLPVITTRANGFSEIMEDKIHGSIIDQPNDMAALRKALELWSEATWRSAARSSILKRAAQFDISKNVARTLEILLQAVAEAASGSENIGKS